MDKVKLMKLAKMILSFAVIKTDKAELTYDGELASGIEVYIDVEGEMKPAEDGEYLTEDEKKLIVKDGKIEEILEVEKGEEEQPKEEEEKVEEVLEEQVEEVAEEPVAEPEKDEKDLRIEELEGLLQEKEAVIEDLTEKLKNLEEQVNKPVEEPVKMNRIEKIGANTDNKALKYFN